MEELPPVEEGEGAAAAKPGSEPRVSASGEKMTARRVQLPWSLWADVLQLAKRAGADYRDVLACVIDLGLQAQEVGHLKPRLVRLDPEAWDRVVALSGKLSVDEDEALARIVDLGVQAQLLEEAAKRPAAAAPAPAPAPEPPRPVGTPVRVEAEGKLLASLVMTEVPVAGEVVVLTGKPYTIVQRAWSVEQGRAAAFLRVQPFK